MTTLEEFRKERGKKSLTETLAEAKAKADEQKLKNLQTWAAEVTETKRMADVLTEQGLL